MAVAAHCAAPTAQRYQRRCRERNLWCRIVQNHLETWLELAGGEDSEAPPVHVERPFRRYLEPFAASACRSARATLAP